jgi:LacI family transcriptional regulator
MAVKKRQPSMTDVAAVAGVSLGTVSNYFNRPDKVSAERRRRVEAAVNQLGFVPNGLARALARGHQQVVALVVLDLNNPYFSIAARGMEDRLAPEGIMLTVASSDEDPDREKACIRLLEEHSVAGLVITPAGASLRSLERLTSRGTPAVLFGRRPPVDGGWCAVSGDDALGGALVGRHLLELGHERITYLNGAGMARLDARREAVRSSVEAAGAKFIEVLCPNMKIAGGEVAMQELLDSDELPTALVCANDLIALGVLRVAERHGIRVPEDVALVGYDDVDFARSLSVPLTTVRQDKYLLGQQAAELLLRELRDETHEHAEVLLTPELVVRASTVGRGGSST